MQTRRVFVLITKKVKLIAIVIGDIKASKGETWKSSRRPEF